MKSSRKRILFFYNIWIVTYRNLLEIKDLVLRFYTYEGVVKALENVNLIMKEGETYSRVAVYLPLEAIRKMNR